MAEFWLILAVFGLAFGCFAALSWLAGRWKQHKIDSSNGMLGQNVRQQKELMKLQAEQARMKQEQELGTELAMAAVEAMEMQQSGREWKDVLVTVVKAHPGAAWFLIQKVIAGEIDVGSLLTKFKLPPQGGGTQ